MNIPHEIMKMGALYRRMRELQMAGRVQEAAVVLSRIDDRLLEVEVCNGSISVDDANIMLALQGRHLGEDGRIRNF